MLTDRSLVARNLSVRFSVQRDSQLLRERIAQAQRLGVTRKGMRCTFWRAA